MPDSVSPRDMGLFEKMENKTVSSMSFMNVSLGVLFCVVRSYDTL